MIEYTQLVLTRDTGVHIDFSRLYRSVPIFRLLGSSTRRKLGTKIVFPPLLILSVMWDDSRKCQLRLLQSSKWRH